MTGCCHEFDVHKFEYARSKLFLVYVSCVVDLNLWRNFFLMFSIRFKINFITFSDLTNGNFWCTTNWLSHVSPSSWVSHPSPHSTPLGYHGAPGWASYATQQLPTACLFYTWAYVSATLSIHPSFSSPCWAHKSVLCVSVPAQQLSLPWSSQTRDDNGNICD